MRLIWTAFLLLAASCATPPADKYVSPGSSREEGAASVPVGANAAGEACTEQSRPNGEAFVYCGAWEQPSGHIVAQSTRVPTTLADTIENSAWRTRLNTRYACGAPTLSTLLGTVPAMTIHCTRKIGGWPQIALVTELDNKIWAADGVEPALPAVEQALGILTGRITPHAAPAASSDTGALAAKRLAAQAISSGDIGQYDQLMTAGARANLTGDYAEAEQAYRAAAVLQEKALGRDNPNLATPLMHQAVQLSNERRFGEADALFARAEALARSPEMHDASAAPRLLHYRGLNMLNQEKPDEALALFAQAERGYASLLPPDAVTVSPPAGASEGGDLSVSAQTRQVEDQQLFSDPVETNALLGLIEARRGQAIADRELGRPDDAERMNQSAYKLARAHHLAQPSIAARLYRTSAVAAGDAGRTDRALIDLSRSTRDFERSLPGTRPVAVTRLLTAARLLRENRLGDALEACRGAAGVLRNLKSGVPSELMEPCLEVYAREAGRSGTQSQTVLTEMFEAAQLAQGSLTGQQIAQASALLSENARDPRVAEAIRRRDSTGQALADLYAQRDALAAARRRGGSAPADPGDLDKKIADAQAAQADADAALQVASPNYGQLVQQVVKASEVLGALRPNEAFAAITLGNQTGWTFLLHGGRIATARIDGGTAKVGDLVKRIRKPMESETAGPPAAFDTDAAQILFTDLFGPVRGQMAGLTAITVAPSGPLLSIPFGLLLTGPAPPSDLGHAPWLIRQMTVAHVPAAANFVTLRKVAGGSRARHPWFGFGDFQRVSLQEANATFPPASCGNSARLFAGLPPLPGALAELGAARKIFSTGPQDELLGPAFTAQQVKQAALKDYRILHFATHALLPTDLPCQPEPAIVTSNPKGAKDARGAFLAASDLARMELDAEAVILSACNTGGPGGGAAGESLSGLARSFFFAGARGLLITHWEVDDRFSAYLVALTLSEFKSRPEQGLGAALRSAQVHALDEATGDRQAQAHPFFWAPLALIGEGSAGAGQRQAMLR